MADFNAGTVATGAANTHNGSRVNTFDIDALLDNRDISIVVTCGSGGVGKTTTAAAIAFKAAEKHGRHVALLTIDPAKRLATALGVDGLHNDPTKIDINGAGSLHALMLDMKKTFDDVVRAQCETERADRIYANPLYKAVSTTFSGTQEYMAIEKVSQLREDSRFDLIVVDTPPSRSALDFLDAPERLTRLMEGPMVRMLAASVPGASKRSLLSVMGASAAVVTRVFNKVLGGHFLTDVAEFAATLQDTFGGFRERADETLAILQGPTSAFVIVAIPEESAIAESVYFTRRIRGKNVNPAGLIVNRVTGVYADVSIERATAAAEILAELNPDDPVSHVMKVHANLARKRSTQDHVASRFSSAFPQVPTVNIPALGSEITDLNELREFFNH